MSTPRLPQFHRRCLRGLGAAALAAIAWAAQAQSEIQDLVSTGQYAAAMQLLDAQSVQAPRDARLIAQRAMLMAIQKRDREALRLLDGLTAQQPELAAAHHLTAMVLLGGGDFEAARAAANRALRAEPNYLPALKTLGEIQARQARQSYEQAMKVERGSAALRDKVNFLTAVIGPEVVGPGASPFAQPGALLALAPRGAAAVQPPPAPATGLFVGSTATTAAVPAQRLVSPPAGVAGAEVAAATRDTDGVRVSTFSGVARGAPVPTGFFGVPMLSVNVDVAAAAAAAAGSAPRNPGLPDVVLAMSPRAAGAPPAGGVGPVPGAGASALAQAEVDAALRQWAAAWSRRDVGGYLAAYASDFAGTARSRDAWERDRRERIAARTRISVELAEVVITVNGDRAEARFRQSYASDTVNAVNRKLLQWQRLPSGAWVIRKESVEG